MEEQRGLTEIREWGRAFVGKNVYFEKTVSTNNPRLRFDISANKQDVVNGKYPIWRHCIALGDIALKLKDIKKGSWISFKGYLQNVHARDAEGHYLFDIKGNPIKKEFLIVEDGFILNETDKNRQLSLIGASGQPPVG